MPLKFLMKYISVNYLLFVLMAFVACDCYIGCFKNISGCHKRFTKSIENISYSMFLVSLSKSHTMSKLIF